MKIGIEINHVVRDINSQILKYFIKDIDKDFDEENVNLRTVNFIKQIPFESTKVKNDFLFVDYPYEVFGCASTTYMHLPVLVNDWEHKLRKDNFGGNFDVSYFSLGEKGLTIQSTFFFLSKTATRVRSVFFPQKPKDIWRECDVVITTNYDVVKSKPSGKVAVVIKMDDNSKAIKSADIVYDDLLQVMKDDKFIQSVNKTLNTKEGWIMSNIKKIIYEFKKHFKH